MSQPVFSTDVRPLADLKKHGSEVVEQALQTRRPVLITRRGRGVVVMLDLGQFEKMREEIEFGRAVDEGAEQAKRREFAASADVAAILGPRRRK